MNNNIQHLLQVKIFKPIFDIGGIKDLGYSMLLCIDYHQTKEDVIYDFLMITDKIHLTDTNIFKKENCYTLSPKEYKWLKKESMVSCALKYQIKESDVKKGLFTVKELKDEQGKQIEIADANYSWICDLRNTLEQSEKHATVIINPIKKQAEIIECGKEYLNNFSNIFGNKNNVSKFKNNNELLRYKSIENEVNKFFKSKNIPLTASYSQEK